MLVNVCGRPVLERYDKATAADHHNMASVTKSVVSTLVGIALAEGALHGLDQTLAQLLRPRRGHVARRRLDHPAAAADDDRRPGPGRAKLFVRPVGRVHRLGP